MWIITEDLLEGKKIAIASCDFDESRASLLIHRFRLIDDDGEIYYEGLSDDCDSQHAFDPLDDFGEGYAGYTELHYFDGDTWNQL